MQFISLVKRIHYHLLLASSIDFQLSHNPSKIQSHNLKNYKFVNSPIIAYYSHENSVTVYRAIVPSSKFPLRLLTRSMSPNISHYKYWDKIVKPSTQFICNVFKKKGKVLKLLMHIVDGSHFILVMDGKIVRQDQFVQF